LAATHGTDAKRAAEIVKTNKTDPASQARVAIGLTDRIVVTRETLDSQKWASDEQLVKAYDAAEKANSPLRPGNRADYLEAKMRIEARRFLVSLREAMKESEVKRLVILECGVGADKELIKEMARFLDVRVEATKGDVQVKTTGEKIELLEKGVGDDRGIPISKDYKYRHIEAAEPPKEPQKKSEN
jgi:hypothetical protein